LSLRLRRRLPTLIDDTASAADDKDPTTTKFLTTLRDFIASARTAKQQVELYQRQLNQGVVGSEKGQLIELQEISRLADADLEECLNNNIPNYVDLEIESFLAKDDTFDHERMQLTKNVQERMFCLGGYEPMGDQCCLLTQRGVQLSQSVEDYLLDALTKDPSFSQKLFQSTQRFELPALLPVSSRVYRYHRWSRTQAPLASTPSDDKAQTMLPSWISVVENHLSTGDKRYYDRVLPQCYVLQLRDSNQHTSAMQATTKKQQRPAWYQKLSVLRQLQVLLVMGPSLVADSRPLQIQWMTHLRDNVFRPLAPTAVLSIRALPPTELLPAEASRLVLESRLFVGNKPVTIQLASLSNFLDYCSTDQMKHGSSIDGRKMHLLQGSLGETALVVEWMLQHCSEVTSDDVDDDSSPDGLCLPACLLSQGTTEEQPLDYTRRIVPRKGGQRSIRSIPARLSVPTAAPGSVINNSTTISPKKSSALLLFTDDRPLQVTPDNIREEAASCPFDFLPFYHR
jgi:hypothetical protein